MISWSSSLFGITFFVPSFLSFLSFSEKILAGAQDVIVLSFSTNDLILI